MEAGLTRIIMKGVEHRKVCSHGIIEESGVRRKAEQPTYDSTWPPHLLIGPNSALPRATVHSQST